MINKVELVQVFACPKCLHVQTHVGTRLPNYCIECGKPVLEELRRRPDLMHVVGDLQINFRAD